MNTTDVKKMNKAELTQVLNLNFGEVKKADKSLADRIAYTAKSYKADEKSVTKKDLLELVNEVAESLGDKFLLEAPAEKPEPPKVESQTKKLKAKSSKKDEGQKPEKKATVRSLGLKKINSVVEHEANEAIKGMVAAVAHLVKVEEIQ